MSDFSTLFQRLSYLSIGILCVLVVFVGSQLLWNQTSTPPALSLPVITPEPTEKPFTRYEPPKIALASGYYIFFVGDSMTKALGPHTNTFSQYINSYYPSHTFLLDNYGVGSTNVLSLAERLTGPTEIEDSEVLKPILGEKFDIIIIESFGHNPLSHMPREEGLKAQEDILLETVKTLIKTHPDSLIVFLATIGPHPTLYASKVKALGEEETRGWANERIEYIQNHIAFAKKYSIPLINVYEKALDENGVVDLRYINPDDYIHPSEEGVTLISKSVADFIRDNELLVE